jgi:hypothetical protein
MESDVAELRRLLQPFVDRYEAKGTKALVKKALTPKRGGRGRPPNPVARAIMAATLKDEERRRQEGSRTPVHDIYKTTFIEERQSPQHYRKWLRTYLRKKADLQA